MAARRPGRDADKPARRGRRRRHLPLLRHQRPGSRRPAGGGLPCRPTRFGCASSMPDRTPRSGWRYPNTTMKVIQTDGYPVVPVQANSVILGMGERVGRDRHRERVAAGGRRAGGQAGPRAAEHAGQQCAERGERRRLRRIGTQGGASGHRDVVTDAGGDAGGQGAGSGDRCPPDRSRQRVHLAGQRQAVQPAERRGAGEAEPAGPDPFHQRVDDVPPVPPTRPHVPGNGCGREEQRPQQAFRRPARTRCWCHPSRRWRSTSTPNNPGKWISHCHNTYHLEAGMAFFSSTAG